MGAPVATVWFVKKFPITQEQVDAYAHAKTVGAKMLYHFLMDTDDVHMEALPASTISAVIGAPTADIEVQHE